MTTTETTTTGNDTDRPPLDHNRVVDAAAMLADRDGLDVVNTYFT